MLKNSQRPFLTRFAKHYKGKILEKGYYDELNQIHVQTEGYYSTKCPSHSGSPLEIDDEYPCD